MTKIKWPTKKHCWQVSEHAAYHVPGRCNSEDFISVFCSCDYFNAGLGRYRLFSAVLSSPRGFLPLVDLKTKPVPCTVQE